MVSSQLVMKVLVRRPRHAALTVVAFALLGTTTSTAAPVTLGFASPELTMYVSVGGGPAHIVQFDTGSLGMFMPKGKLGPGAKVSTTATCSTTYVSSGISLSGHQATASVTLLGSKASGDLNPAPTTVEMSLCAVDTPADFNGGMMGVGFGRSSPGQNAVLLIQDVVSGKLKPGYVLSTTPSPHVIVGLDASTMAGFQTVPLSPDPNFSGDWLATSLRGCLTLPNNSAYTTACGSLLVDTGIPECILWGLKDTTLGGSVPKGQTLVPDGVAMQIALGPNTGMTYAFQANTSSNSPATISIRGSSAFSINTGRNLLLSFDYLFDAAGGNAGFRATSNVTSPLITAAGVVNAASDAGGVSPSEIVTIYGANIGPAQPVSAAPVGGLFPAALAGVQVTVNNKPAPLLFVSSGQISAVVPGSVAQSQNANVQVVYNSVTSAAAQVPVSSAIPGLFSADGSGKGPGAFLNQDGTLNSTANPAPANSVVVMYATGLGATDVPEPDGQIVTAAPLPKPTQTPQVLIGGKTAAVDYIGAAPYLVYGLFQINAHIPAGLAPGAQPVTLKMGSGVSQTGVTVAVQ
jgi:uncharacterized protein (TIGR03437 family)